MSVWILKWDYPNEMDNNITVWDSEEGAFQQAASEIEDKITNDWDMDDPDQSRYADKISDLHKQGKYSEAVQEWNDYQDNYNDQYGEWYFVFEEEVHTTSTSKVEVATVAYKASCSGATCRGPCKQYNDYAYADQPDGTYVCHQCSTFQHIFGAKP